MKYMYNKLNNLNLMWVKIRGETGDKTNST